MAGSTTPRTTREQILDAAVHLFAVKGYAHTGMDEIAKEVGITKPAIYYHFESKEKLFRTLMERLEEFQEKSVQEIAEKNLDIHDLLEEVILRTIMLLREVPDWFQMMHRILTADPELAELIDLRAHHLKDHERFLKLFQNPLRGHRLRPGLNPDDFVDHFLNVLGGNIAHWQFLKEPLDETEAPRRIRDQILYGTLEPPVTREGPRAPAAL